MSEAKNEKNDPHEIDLFKRRGNYLSFGEIYIFHFSK